MTYKELIEQQQAALENTDPAWMVGMQLMDICRADPSCGTIVAKDLENPDMSLLAAAKKLAEYAAKNRGKKKCYCITPDIAEGIIREFYGLPGASLEKAEEPTPSVPILSLADFV